MLDFKTPTIEDRDWVRSIFHSAETLGSDNTFGNVYFWRESTKIKILKYKSLILRRYIDTDKIVKYRFPLGQGDVAEAIALLKNDAEQAKLPLVLGGITEDEKKELQRIMPDQFDFVEEPNREDYIYNTSDLINLSGRRYHAKRNHIAKFKNNYTWQYFDINKGNIPECKRFVDYWFARNLENKPANISEEKVAIHKALDYFDYFNLLGGVILVDFKVVALTIAEAINDNIVDIHFEKALTNYSGVYAMINNEFARRKLSPFQYINREEDLGIEGLRKSKMSYHPCKILKRYEARPLDAVAR
ncbi:MAG: DUF2156 domain-containing protein [Clostridia bacterium]|nr:DUF2156 domain-containing protein [Clostridia bacterium]